MNDTLSIRTGLLALCSIMLSCQVAFGKTPPVYFKKGEASFSLKDPIKHPFYWWPKTLLHYQVHFDGPVKQQDFTLAENGQPIPFQFSDPQRAADGGSLVTVSFLSDLPSGGARNFTLKAGISPATAPLPVTAEGKSWLLKTNRLAVRIPASQVITGRAPGPVMQVFPVQGQALGQSVFNAGTRQLVKIETEQVARGPVFTAFKVSYLFKDGARYQATVTCIRDYDFVELREEMSGIEKGEKVNWKMEWTHLQPTHRQAPNHPYGGPGDQPGFGRFQWEAIDQKMLSSHHGVMPDPAEEGKIPFEVGLYQPWPAERTVTSSVFWDEKKGQSVGVFIKDAAFWNDKDYPVWQSSRILDIRFFYRDGLLSFEYPVAKGTRSTGISCYPHKQDIAYMEELEEKSKRRKHPSGFNYNTKIAQLSYNTYLQNRYGTIDLNKVKDWVLYYPAAAPVPPPIFKETDLKAVADLERFFYGGYTAELTFSGTRQNGGYSPVPARSFYETYTPAYNQLYASLPPQDKERLAAMFLMQAYVSADEEYMPMKHMLSGHPNFLADVKTIPAMAAFLFPQHPEAKNWTDLFEKYVDLNTRYHTRPDVKAWNARGGRWTENLSAYTWAFLRPTLQTNFLLGAYDKKNRVAGVHTTQIGTWLLNSLSAPYGGEALDFYRTPKGSLDKHTWGVVTPDKGPQRVHPPLGAHSIRRQPPGFFWALGESLKNYAPLLSENIRYISHPDHQNMKAPDQEASAFDKIMFPQDNYDKGTPPDLKTIKLTGYGNILRAGVGTPEELSVHLMQIDQGPNYRWGRAAEGGTGTIYFYAAGKSYSQNGKEDIGDRRLEDTDLMTNFGVFKDGTFKSIGQNVLHRPLYDLESGQFTEIVPARDKPYSWPEYQSRSLMLVGADYFITYDDVHNKNIGTRFSWFTHLEEELPQLEVIKAGGTEDRNRVMKTELRGPETKGVYFDGTNDFMVFVSHKKGYVIKPEKFGCTITSALGQKDYIYRNEVAVEVAEADQVFRGTAGFMRLQPDGTQELALFHGERIGNGRFLMSSSDTDAGISARLEPHGFIAGRFYSPKAARITFSGSQLAAGMHLYVDGQLQATTHTGNGFELVFPAGQHEWQISKGLPIPVRPQVVSSENDKGKVHLFFAASAGARKYKVALSRDNGQSWQQIGETSMPAYTVAPVAGLSKAHVRVTAINREHESEASPAYPVYFTREKPATPDGLKASLTDEGAELTWGRVLGVPTYKLYRRKKGEQAYQLVYSGKGNSFADKPKARDVIYEYVVAGQNRNGESVKSSPVDTDPESWLHWEPRPGEKFRRTNTTIGVDKDQRYYPE